jgi:poly-beta-1,6-N-acetyl-D-glucosamine synthase
MNSDLAAHPFRLETQAKEPLTELQHVRYVVVSPVRDEEANIGRTIVSMLKQTIRPVEWVLVNDGSRDRTAELIREYAANESWIHLVNRADRGFRKSGGGVMEAFYSGYDTLETTNWDFLVKLDGDLSFSEDYFARCLLHFRENPKLGVGGGVIAYQTDRGLQFETNHEFHVRGATKIYRNQCWNAIGGLLRSTGWDTLDEVKANMLGWESQTFGELAIIQHRGTGAADGNWKNSFKNGRANYVCGYHPVFMFLKCVKRLVQRPFLIDSAGLASGYLSGYLFRLPRVEDRNVIRYLRKQQLDKLRFRESIWK